MHFINRHHQDFISAAAAKGLEARIDFVKGEKAEVLKGNYCVRLWSSCAPGLYEIEFADVYDNLGDAVREALVFVESYGQPRRIPVKKLVYACLAISAVIGAVALYLVTREAPHPHPFEVACRPVISGFDDRTDTLENRVKRASALHACREFIQSIERVE